MGIGVSVFIIAVGAILTFALERTVEGIDLNTVGVILMIVGAIGLLWTMAIWGPRTRRTVVEEQADVMPARRTVYREQV